MSSLDSRYAVVTGAARGIGRATALALARANADVMVHARQDRAGAEATAAQIRQLGRQAAVHLGDLAEPAACDALVAAAFAWQPRVDVWFNNAGADVLTGPAADGAFDAKLQRLWHVDVLATIRLSRAVGQRMQRQRHGVIINMGWDQAEQGMAGDSGEMFAAVKGAVMAFSRSLAQSLAPQVRVNCVAPGWIKTAWGQHASPAWQRRARAESLRQRWGTPEDVAQLVCFLASPEADFLNGQVIAVNGGFCHGASAAIADR
jgi:3-oxoacyl-[acyl-carrier protein] reductase